MITFLGAQVARPLFSRVGSTAVTTFIRICVYFPPVDNYGLFRVSFVILSLSQLTWSSPSITYNILHITGSTVLDVRLFRYFVDNAAFLLSSSHRVFVFARPPNLSSPFLQVLHYRNAVLIVAPHS